MKNQTGVKKEDLFMKGNQSIRVIIIDDIDHVRHDLKMALELIENIKVIGEAGDGETAVKLVEKLKPDIVLMDLKMPGMTGFEAASKIHKLTDTCTLVALTLYDGEEIRLQAAESGFKAFIVKGTPLKHLVETIQNLVKQ
jgi:DNA-binding NarL/FixJ family response regulator